MKLEHSIYISGAILVVYYVDNFYYQYEILFWDSSIRQPQEIYKTADQALEIGVESIKIVTDNQ